MVVRKVSIFDSPLFLGFDEFEEVIDKVSRSSDVYPPYNIEKISSLEIRITLAVAGFSSDNLSVTLEDNQLVIRGKQDSKNENRTFLYRGIASRQFQRNFVLAEGLEIVGSFLDNGLLNIDVKRPTPKVQVREITIQTKKPQKDNNMIEFKQKDDIVIK